MRSAHVQQPTITLSLPSPPAGGIQRKSVVVSKARQSPSPTSTSPTQSSPSPPIPVPIAKPTHTSSSPFKFIDRTPIRKEARLQGSSRFSDKKKDIARLPHIKDAPTREEQQALVIQKLRQCHILFDFTDSMRDVKGKDIKRGALMELIEYIKSGGVRGAHVC